MTDEFQVATSLIERVAGLSVWMCQVFDYDLSYELKNDLLEYSRRIRLKNNINPQTPDYITHIIMDDLVNIPEGHLVSRRGFIQILNALALYVKGINLKNETSSRILNDTDKNWTIILGGMPIFSEEMKIKAQSILMENNEPFIIIAQNSYGQKQIGYVLNFNNPTVPK